MRKRRRIPKPKKVGYCNPPVETRFPPGKSGNLKGRPKGRLNVKTLMKKALDQTIEVKENGRLRKMKRSEAVVTAMVNKAIRGDVRAAFQLIDMMSVLDLDDKRRSTLVANHKVNLEKALSEATDEELKTLERFYMRMENTSANDSN